MTIVGVIFAASLGPSGRVQASAHADAPGVVVVSRGVLNASSTPAHVTITSPAGGDVSVVRLLDDDAAAAAQSARRTTIEGVTFLPRRLEATTTGEGTLTRTLNTDTHLAKPDTSARVELDVASSRLPQALLAFPGSPGAARDEALDVTMTWENAAWFWQSVALTLAGLALASYGGWRARHARATADPATAAPAAAGPATADRPTAHLPAADHDATEGSDR